MNRSNLKKFLAPLALFVLLAAGQTRAADASDATAVVGPATATDSTMTTAGATDNSEPTLPITLAQFDTLRNLIQRQSDNAAQLDKDFQAFLDDLLGTTAAVTP